MILLRHTGPALHSLAAKDLAVGGAHWPLDDVVGPIRELISGITGSVVGALTLGATGPTLQGDTGKAVSWPGSVAYLNCGTDSRFNVGTGDFSWGIWFKGPENGANGWRWLVCHNGYGYKPGAWLATNAGRICCAVGTWYARVCVNGAVINETDLYFLALTRAGGVVQTYLNGEPWGPATIGNTTDLGSIRGILLGSGPSTDVPSRNGAGLCLSMATFAPAAWTAEQVAALYGEQLPKTLILEVTR